MIKNIVLDIGGILFDDSKSNVEKLLHKNCDTIYKKLMVEISRNV